MADKYYRVWKKQDWKMTDCFVFHEEYYCYCYCHYCTTTTTTSTTTEATCCRRVQEGASVVHLQMGSNKGATQRGMKMGGLRHVTDIRADQMDRASEAVIHLQYGSTAGATQAGMSMGGRRDIRGPVTTT